MNHPDDLRKVKSEKPLDPEKVICIIKDSKGVVVRRMPATHPNGSNILTELTRQHGPLTVDYEEAKDSDNNLLIDITKRATF